MYILYECDKDISVIHSLGLLPVGEQVLPYHLSMQELGSHCNRNNSEVGLYLCRLDAEGAFDAIPHPVLFAKRSKVTSDVS